ncbi:MAG: RluA family pseudouridine synthase [Clostridia bacterium]|nr:RluA family pseudouridine synthase [Clostridia bacterium]
MEESFFAEGGVRLDVFLSERTGLTRSGVKKLVEDGQVTMEGRPVKKAGEIAKGEVVVEIREPVPISAEGEDIPIGIVYEDKDIVVVNKPQGLVTHPCAGTPKGTLVNALVYRVKDLSAINGVTRPGIVHRLDKDTSGLLVVAKNNEAHLSLAKQIEEKTAGRHYLALLVGNIKEDEGTIDRPIGRSTRDRKLMAIDERGRRAVTHYYVRERFGDFTLVEFVLETGRTHQIRVHAKSINHPVVGDVAYGKKDDFGLKGQLLHAYKLCLTHPTTGKRMEFVAPLPDYFSAVLDKLRKKTNR